MGSEKRCQSSRSTVQCSAKSLPNLADKSKLIIIIIKKRNKCPNGGRISDVL
jgi:hypothetical protein